MSERPRREEKKASTRNALLAAAGALIASAGAEAASLERIAEAAGFTKGAIYSNFESKEDLIIAVADALATNVGLDEMIDGTAPLVEQFETLGRRVAREGRTISRMAWRLNYELFQYAMRNRTLATKLVERDRDGVERDGARLEDIADRRREQLPMNGADLVRVMSAMALGLVQQQAIDPDGITDDLFAKAFRLLAGG